MKTFKILFLIILVAGISYGAWFSVQASKCPDSDLDGLNDCNEESVYHTDRFNPDTDGDGYKDGEEVSNGYSPVYGGNLKMNEVDSDRDGLMDSEEIKAGTNLNEADSDGDGVNDFVERQNGGNPLDGKSTESSFGKLKNTILGK